MGERPRVVDGSYMFKGDTRDVSDKMADALRETADIVIVENKAIAQPEVQAKLIEVVDSQIVAEPVPEVVVEPRHFEVRAKASPRNPRGKKK
jgi:hypothetical protein